ncbi:MAG: peptidase family protein [Frankiales bacterium]|nr:peptidase family protein [Frankiales bacterium]
MKATSYDERRARVAGLLAGRDVDAILVTTPMNVRYLTGFTGSNGAVLVYGDVVRLATDGRYEEQARRETGIHDLDITRDLMRVLVEAAGSRGASVVGFEREHLTVARHDVLRAAAGDAHVDLRGVTGIVECARQVKDESELDALRRAAAIADAAFADVVPRLLRPGSTERDVAVALEESMRRLGADAPAFATIVAAGVNGAEPHHSPTSYAIRAGDLVTIDMGARLDGYHSDMTRTVCVGAPEPWQRDIYAVAQAAQRAGRAAVREGTPARTIDSAARAVIEAAGFGEFFVHGVGHGVGLQIHEAPMLFGDTEVTLEAGMVVTVEPGIYLPGRGGVRIEDTVVVGTGEVLTRASYDGVVGSARP